MSIGEEEVKVAEYGKKCVDCVTAIFDKEIDDKKKEGGYANAEVAETSCCGGCDISDCEDGDCCCIIM